MARTVGSAVAERVTVATISVTGMTAVALRRSEERGMTLVECLIALVVISVGLVGLMSAIPLAAANVQNGNTLSTATFLANARIETVKSTAIPSPGNPGYAGTYDTPPPPTPPTCTGIASDTITPLAGTETDVTVSGFTSTGYSRTTQVSDVPDTGVCPMKQVTVTTSYRGKSKAIITIQIAPGEAIP